MWNCIGLVIQKTKAY